MGRNRHRLALEYCDRLWVHGPDNIELSGPCRLDRIPDGRVAVETPDQRMQPISLTSIPLPWGFSSRWFALCPQCHRRVKMLCLPGARNRWACRVCHGLTYLSRQQYDKRLSRVLREHPPEEIPGLPGRSFPSVLVALRALERIGWSLPSSWPANSVNL
jgi:hypothetical protein